MIYFDSPTITPIPEFEGDIPAQVEEFLKSLEDE